MGMSSRLLATLVYDGFAQRPCRKSPVDVCIERYIDSRHSCTAVQVGNMVYDSEQPRRVRG